MRRWAIAIVILLACCAGVFMHRSANPLMLEDSDTKGLLAGIAKRDAPLSWFASDWPIENHFYRPVSTLTLELNHRVPELNNVAGFGLVNVFLCVLSIAALFWLTRELTDNPLFTALATAIFAGRNIDWSGFLRYQPLFTYAIWILPLALLLPNRDYKKVLGAMLVVGFLVPEVALSIELYHRTIGWIPGRTATTMTIFALCSLAAYARYERFAQIAPKPLESTDLPSTKSSKHVQAASKLHFLWPIVSCLCLALALGSYEQAVMVPGLLAGVGIWFAISRRKVRWAWHAAFWGVLLAYFAVRHAVLPPGVSQYQNQQFRSGPGVWLELADWLLPCVQSIRSFWVNLTPDTWVLAFPNFVLMAWGIASNASAFFAMAKKLPMAFGAWAMSFLAFMPMAWLHRFEHYYYFPYALRAIFLTGLLAIAYQWVVSAWSPRSIQAPLRLDPAPGSLPRP